MIRAVILAAAMAAAVPARAGVVTLDPERTAIAFTLGATLHTVHGTARLKSAAIRFDPESGEASGEVVIDARSLETGNARRDATMHAEVLESATWPEIRFTPRRVDGRFEPDGRSDLTLAGTVAIHGAEHDLSIAVQVTAAPGRLTGAARFEIPYVAWGMKDPSVFVLRVEKSVQVAIAFEGRWTLPEPG